jgi:hypothetical protein
MSTVFKPQNQNERLLMSMPLDCQCNACKDTRKHLEKELGKKKFNDLNKLLESAS